MVMEHGMLIRVKALKDFRLNCLNGEIGRVQELYFDDRHWIVRYLVADTGAWLPGLQVLISPYALGVISVEDHNIAVSLTKRQLEDSPPLASAKPVSRQFEEAYHAFHGWPHYWGGPGAWGAQDVLTRDGSGYPLPDASDVSHDYHLRSTAAVSGYSLAAKDGELGHVDDFIVDDSNWAIRYLVVDTHHWLPGRKVLVAPRWIERMSWEDSKVHVGLTREAVKASPEYSESLLASRAYESKLHRHYDRSGYWSQ
jgi:hypothetical protein